ncbi:Holliday junction branch migration protein RuvA [Megasphaera elsdenii]|uniref:Holliday junction branch migration protein RuvA n=1 Tax=Megasphaera TaxID=906 RepID=UPI001D00BD45|nr:Holliday junction branch migration protein RuvA [Megasphaera elsdenii]MCB5702336.1 Holliday junction branch migration protein RuvA [Megasphaera elsdenii]MCB5726615.1 Holliday junction branch migration protein RuvA [Megasphaera elsdenii]MCB5770394.1 Holliday junction branch migration protein RuvA [Megasphaera elsdenii]
MIGYLKGIISHIFTNSCFIDVHGVGYRAYAPASTLDGLTVGKEALLYTYMSVREDAIVLYGFATQDEYDLFMLLIGVNGVGPKVALGILSAGTADSFRLAVHKKDIKGLTKMPGIGKKTAERIVLELQDKIGPVAGGDTPADVDKASAPGMSAILAETLTALTSLGYSEQEVLPVAESHLASCMTVEQLLKETLKTLGSGR